MTRSCAEYARDWSPERPHPDMPGWYWWRVSRESLPIIVLLSAGNVHSVLEVNGDARTSVKDWPDGLWYGPLAVPLSREDVKETTERADALIDDLDKTLDEW